MPPLKHPNPRRSTGPLSSRTLSTVRCPTRTDFLEKHPRALSFPTDFSSPNLPHPPSPSSSEGSVPEHLSAAFLDAVDRLDIFPELHALTIWLDDLRASRGFKLLPTDIDLSNGVALLDALYIVDSTLFASIEYANDHDASVAPGVPRPYVTRTLDQKGEAARRNVSTLRAILDRFPWRDISDAGQTLPTNPDFDFANVDVWALAGFVALAARTCARSEEFSREMDAAEDWIRGCLEDVVWRGLRALGGARRAENGSYCASSATTNTLSSAASAELVEMERETARWRRKADEARRRAEDEARRRAEAVRLAGVERRKAQREMEGRVRAERAVARLTKLVEEMRAARGPPLREVNGGVVRGVQALRAENARLRRTLADVEKERDAKKRLDGRREKDGRRGGRRGLLGRGIGGVG